MATFSDHWHVLLDPSNTSNYFKVPVVVKAQDYYPFGMEMPGRTYSANGEYRFGFNGKESDKNGEWGGLTHYDYGFRIYNPAVARFLSIDPLTKSYPMLTPYQFASNTPIQAIDLDGLEAWIVNYNHYNDGTTELEFVFDEEVERTTGVYLHFNYPMSEDINDTELYTYTEGTASYSDFPEQFPNFSEGYFGETSRERTDGRDLLSFDARGALHQGGMGVGLKAFGLKGGAYVGVNEADILAFSANTDLDNRYIIDIDGHIGRNGDEVWDRGFEFGLITGFEYREEWPQSEANYYGGSGPNKNTILEYSGGIANIEHNLTNKETAMTWNFGGKLGLGIIGGEVEVNIKINLPSKRKYTEYETKVLEFSN